MPPGLYYCGGDEYTFETVLSYAEGILYFFLQVGDKEGRVSLDASRDLEPIRAQ